MDESNPTTFNNNTVNEKQQVIPVICKTNQEKCLECLATPLQATVTPQRELTTNTTNPHIYCFKCKLKTTNKKKSFVLIETSNTEEHKLAIDLLKSKFPEADVRNVIEEDSGGESETPTGKDTLKYDTIECLERLSLNLNQDELNNNKCKHNLNEKSLSERSTSSDMERQGSKDSGYWSLSKTSFESMKSLSINENDANIKLASTSGTLSPNSAYRNISNWKKWKKDAANRYNLSNSESISELKSETSETSGSFEEISPNCINNNNNDLHIKRGKLIRELTIDDEHSNNSNSDASCVPTIIVNNPTGGRVSPPEKRASIVKQMSIDETIPTSEEQDDYLKKQQQQQQKSKYIKLGINKIDNNYAFNSFDSYLNAKSHLQSQQQQHQDYYYTSNYHTYPNANLLNHSNSLDTPLTTLHHPNQFSAFQQPTKPQHSSFNIQSLFSNHQNLKKDAYNFTIPNQMSLNSNNFTFSFIQPQFYSSNDKIQFPLVDNRASCMVPNLTNPTTSPIQLPSETNKPHVCKFCQKKFARSDMLIRHSRLHSGIRPYKCNQCSQEFSRSDHLNTHQRTHTGEKPYSCPFPKCTYAACRKDMITRHLKVHNKNRTIQQQQQQNLLQASNIDDDADEQQQQVLNVSEIKIPKIEPID